MSDAYDVIVIGSGPAGEGTAMKCAKYGKQVAVVESHAQVGGSCTHRGTIPSKAMRQPIQTMVELRHNSLLREELHHVNLHLPHLMRNAEAVIRSQVQMRAQFYHRNQVNIIEGHASLKSANQISVANSNGTHREYSAHHIVIATGSHPYQPPGLNFSNPRILDSDTVLELPDTPRSMTIYGAGVIGCEYASIFRGLGCKVTLINTRDKLLSFLDDDIIDALAYHLREQGVLIKHNEEMVGVTELDDGIVLELDSGKQIKSEYLLWANGRTGNSSNLGLEELGIEINQRGNISINENYQTNQPHIYAVGDVIGPPGLASASYDQGRFAAAHLCEGNSSIRLDQQTIPTGIYTSPEISSLGYTERELTHDKIPYEVGQAFFKSLARAQITGNTVGMLKLIFHRENKQILGIHCFGYQAAEIIHIGQAIMIQKGEANTIEYFSRATFNYPTMAEAYRVAALNGLNRLYES